MLEGIPSLTGGGASPSFAQGGNSGADWVVNFGSGNAGGSPVAGGLPAWAPWAIVGALALVLVWRRKARR